MAASLIALLLLAAPSEPSDLDRMISGRIRAATGAEWDTNAYRSIEGQESGRQGPLEQDGLLRFLLSAQGRLRLSEKHAFTATYLMGAKRFFAESDQDLLAHDLTVGSQHLIAQGWMLTTSGRYRASRIDDDSRSYDLGLASVGARWLPHPKWELAANGGFVANRFVAQPFFSYYGAQANLTVSHRPVRQLRLSVTGGYQFRDYPRNQFAEVVVVDADGNRSEPELLICAERMTVAPDQAGIICDPTRRDNEGQLTVAATWQGAFVVNAFYLLRIQRSTLSFENVNRHRLSVSATVGLPWSITTSLMGALQFSNGVSPTDVAGLAEDDENQNSLQVKLQRPIGADFSIELRYGLFANQFSTADVSFFRQTAYLGVSYATGI